RRTLFADNLSKRGWVDGPHDGSSWSRRPVMDSVVPYFINSSATLFITLDGRYDGSSQAQQSVEGFCSITLKLLEFGYWDYLFDNHGEPAGQTVMATMVRHALRNHTLGQTSPSSFSSFTTMPPTDRHRHDGPSQA
ncbi:hypothetical protein EJD97_008635, partial [Solanum chilense]